MWNALVSYENERRRGRESGKTRFKAQLEGRSENIMRALAMSRAGDERLDANISAEYRKERFGKLRPTVPVRI